MLESELRVFGPTEAYSSLQNSSLISMVLAFSWQDLLERLLTFFLMISFGVIHDKCFPQLVIVNTICLCLFNSPQDVFTSTIFYCEEKVSIMEFIFVKEG